MYLRPPTGSSTPGDIIQYENGRGSSDWTGPQGNSDAWLLAQQYVNGTLKSALATRSAYITLFGRLG